MLRTIEAIIDKNGNVRLLESVRLERSTRALVTILEAGGAIAEEPLPSGALLSERVLAVDWERPEEEAAWTHLQPAP
jgi:hypothetical protein